MRKPAPVPRHRRNPRRAYDESGQEIPCPTVGSCRAAGETTAAIQRSCQVVALDEAAARNDTNLLTGDLRERVLHMADLLRERNP